MKCSRCQHENPPGSAFCLECGGRLAPAYASCGAELPPVTNGIWSQHDVYEIWLEEFEGAYAEGGFFKLMGHPQVIGCPSRMRIVERLIRHMLGKKDVWFAVPIEVACRA